MELYWTISGLVQNFAELTPQLLLYESELTYKEYLMPHIWKLTLKWKQFRTLIT